jgi:hypothetical protein
VARTEQICVAAFASDISKEYHWAGAHRWDRARHHMSSLLGFDRTGVCFMMNQKNPNRLLLYELIGFSLIIALSWLDEFLGLPHLLFGGVAPHPSWREAATETVTIMCVAIPVLVLTRRLLTRLFYLESFLRVCAWCKKISRGDQWISLEDYLTVGFNTETTHGICPDCLERVKRGGR